MNIETANRLLQLRKKSGLSQEALAEKIGVSRQAISKWERAEASPDTDNLVVLAKLYGVSLDELLMGETVDNSETDEAGTDNSGENETAQDEEADESQGNADAPKDYVNFHNGIHVHDKDGTKVDINLRDGIHVHDEKGTEVHIDSKGVYVDDNGNHVYEGSVKDFCHEQHKKHKASRLSLFPYTMLSVVVYLALGFAMNAWWIAWIVFLTIPLFYSAIEAVQKRDPAKFAYPVLVAAVFLFIGMFWGLWHPTWIVFLTVPLYYGIISMIKGHEN